MPNWCENDLAMTGPEDRIQNLLVFIGMEDAKPRFDFDRVIPYPEKFKALDRLAQEAREKDPENGWKLKDGYNQGGYEWCCENWGTKWSAQQTKVMEREDGYAFLSFDTAWTPPHPVIEALAKQFPELTFTHEWFEGGCGFQGHRVYANKEDAVKYDGLAEEEWEPGCVTQDSEGDYDGPRGG